MQKSCPKCPKIGLRPFLERLNSFSRFVRKLSEKLSKNTRQAVWLSRKRFRTKSRTILSESCPKHQKCAAPHHLGSGFVLFGAAVLFGVLDILHQITGLTVKKFTDYRQVISIQNFPFADFLDCAFSEQFFFAQLVRGVPCFF